MHVLCMYLLSKLFSFILLFSFCVYTFLSFYSHFYKKKEKKRKNEGILISQR